MASFSQRWNEGTVALAKTLRKSSKFISNATIAELTNASEMFLRNGLAAYVPVYTGNLADSMGVQILQYRRLLSMSWLPKIATRPQHYRASEDAPSEKVWGRQRLALMMGRARNVQSNGIVSQFLIAAPYAEMLNSTLKHGGYLIELEKSFYEYMYNAAKKLETYNWQM